MKKFHELVVESLITKNINESWSSEQDLPHNAKDPKHLDFDHLNTAQIHQNLDHVFNNKMTNDHNILKSHAYAKNIDAKGLHRIARMSDDKHVHLAVAGNRKTSTETLSHIAKHTSSGNTAIEVINNHNNHPDNTHHIVMNLSRFPKEDHKKILNAARRNPNTAPDTLKHISNISPEHKI